MKHFLRRYGPAVGVAAIFVGVFLVLLPSLLGRDAVRDHSALRKNLWGCAALAELCRRADPALRVEVLTRPLNDLSRVRGLLLILDPERPFTSSELREVVRWVEAGGVLVVAIEGPWDDPAAWGPSGAPGYLDLTTALGLAVVDTETRRAEATPARGSAFAEGVRRVAIHTRYVVAPLTQDRAEALVTHGADDVTPELVADGQPIMVSFRHGRGQVLFSSDAEMFANAMLGKEDNVQFAANLLWGRAEGGAVYFDEVHHGSGVGAAAGSVPDRAPLDRALFVAAVGIGVFLVGRSIRFGAPVPVFDSRRRTAMEYVEALAGLFRRGQANQWALEKIVLAFRHRLAPGVGLPPTAEAGSLAAALAERRGLPPAETLALLSDVEEAVDRAPVGGRRLAELVARMTGLEERANARPLRRPTPAQQGRAPGDE